MAEPPDERESIHDEPAAASAEGEEESTFGIGPAPRDDHRWAYRLMYTFIFTIFALWGTLWLLNRLRGLVIILLVALFVSFALEPAVGFLARRGWKRGVATFFTFAMVGLVSLVMLFAVGRLVVDQVAQLVDKAPDLIEESAGWLNDTFGFEIDTEGLQNKLADEDSPFRDAASNLASRAFALSVSAVGLLFNFFTMLLFAFYLTAEGPKVRRFICSLLPQNRQRAVLQGWEIAIEKTGGYLYSRALLAALSAFLGAIFLFAIRVPYPLALALFMGVTSQFIPTVGTYIGGALPVLIATLDDPVKGLATLVYILIYQQIENYFFSPRITAKTMSLHPAVAFGTVIVGGTLAGGIGALLALPAAAVLQAIGSTYIRRHELIDSEMFSEEVREDDDDGPNLIERLKARRAARSSRSP